MEDFARDSTKFLRKKGVVELEAGVMEHGARSNGVLEYWSTGVSELLDNNLIRDTNKTSLHHSITPLLHCSNTPLLRAPRSVLSSLAPNFPRKSLQRVVLRCALNSSLLDRRAAFSKRP